MISDPYVSTSRCVDRLLEEYRQHPKLIVACDFDDTVYDYDKGAEHIGVLQLLRRCQSHGFYLVLFTASPPDRFVEMVGYLGQQGITVHSVNANPVPLRFGHHGKPYYNILLDDRAGLGQACEVLELLLNKISQMGPSTWFL